MAAAGKGVVVPSGKYWGDVYVPIGLELLLLCFRESSPTTRAHHTSRDGKNHYKIPSHDYRREKDITYNESDIKSSMV